MKTVEALGPSTAPTASRMSGIATARSNISPLSMQLARRFAPGSLLNSWPAR
ncbi:MAG: hypothetical protein ACKVQK_07750 [Burkholderiales bacterium]